VLAFGVIAVAHWWIVSGFYGRRHAWTWQAMPVTIAHSQAALAAYWVAFVGTLKPWRLLVVAGAFCGLPLLLAKVTPRAMDELSLAYGAQPLITSAVFLVVRITGVQEVAARQAAHASHARQFSLMNLLLWTTCVCGVLAISRHTPPIARTFDTLMRKPEIAVDVGFIAAIAVVALWTGLSNRRASFRYTLLLIACATYFALIGPLYNDRFWSNQSTWQWAATFSFGYPLLFTVWLMPLRWLDGQRHDHRHRAGAMLVQGHQSL
jgi:hypothetical protein